MLQCRQKIKQRGSVGEIKGQADYRGGFEEERLRKPVFGALVWLQPQEKKKEQESEQAKEIRGRYWGKNAKGKQP